MRKSAGLYRAYSVVLGVIALVAVAFLIGVILLSVVSYAPKNVFGTTVLRVESGSMAPFLDAGDVVLCDEAESVATGDVVLFRAASGVYAGRYVLHRVVAKEDTEKGVVLVTKGDASDSADTRKLSEDDVVAKFRKKLTVLTAFMNFRDTPAGKGVMFGLPSVFAAVAVAFEIAFASRGRVRVKNSDRT